MGASIEYLTFEQVGTTLASIAIALTFIVLVFNATKAIHEWRIRAKKPTDEKFQEHGKIIQDHETRIGHLEECCSDVHGKLVNDWEFQRTLAETNRLLLRSIKLLLKHNIDGDDTEGLQAMEDAIDNYLLEHQK